MASGQPILVPSLPRMNAGGPRDKDVMLPEEIAMSPPKPQLTAPPVFKEAVEEDIAWIVEKFAAGAARAVEAGYDAIELHAGHTYLINNYAVGRALLSS